MLNRAIFPTRAAGRRIDMGQTRSALEIDPDLTSQILVEFIRSELHRAGFERGVVGVSGGVDSAVTCFLAARALGPENVLALSLPYQTTSEEARLHSARVIEATGVQTRTIDITPVVEPYFELMPEMDRVRRGNVMARARMLILYDHSAEFNALVIGTGNKTEILLGYTTLYGDSACAINPVGDLYKTQIRELAKNLGVPQEIIAKAPSADLWQGQTDEDELGFTYDQVDGLLSLLVDGRMSPEGCIQAGYSAAFVEQVQRRVQNTQYKRVLPPIAKLSNRTVGYDFLYPRDWGT
jgi:NAD+ synthase